MGWRSFLTTALLAGDVGRGAGRNSPRNPLRQDAPDISASCQAVKKAVVTL